MKMIDRTIRILLAGLFVITIWHPHVNAQEVDAETLVRSQDPDTLIANLDAEEIDSLIASLPPEQADVLLQNLLSAQDTSPSNVQNFTRQVQSFTVSDTAEVSFEYVDVKDRYGLLQLAAAMRDLRNYPVVVFKKDVFIPGMDILRTLDLQIKNYEHRDEQWQLLDSINKAKYAQLENIVNLQGQRVENYKSANTQLNEQIQMLNDQLTASVELTEKSLKGRTRRNLWIGALGGVFGFSLGVLISAL